MYQHKRINPALGYLTPPEVEAGHQARLLSPVVLPSHGALKCLVLGAQFRPDEPFAPPPLLSYRAVLQALQSQQIVV